MALYYRIMSEKYHQQPYSCSMFGARWNPKGFSMIYAANTASLAALEYLCIKGTSVLHEAWYMLTFEIKNEDLIGTLELDSLPANWDVLTHGKVTQEFGKQWLQEKSFPFLKVPTARMPVSLYPGEHNLLINPMFSDIQENFVFRDSKMFAYKLGSNVLIA